VIKNWTKGRTPKSIRPCNFYHALVYHDIPAFTSIFLAYLQICKNYMEKTGEGWRIITENDQRISRYFKIELLKNARRESLSFFLTKNQVQWGKRRREGSP
jgi:hypothetical protein